MKKSIALLAACLLFTACGASEETPAETTANEAITTVGENTASSETEETAAADEPAINENPDFRNVSWGMSVEEVKKYEDANLISEEDENDNILYNLIYDGISVMDHPAKLGYSIRNGKLSAATYMIDVTENADYKINNEFFEIADGISAKYGTPEQKSLLIYCDKDIYFDQQTFSEIDNFSFDVSEYCKANNDDYAMPIYAITWKADNTEIRLDMFIPKNDDGIYIAPDTYEISYRAIDVDNAL